MSSRGSASGVVAQGSLLSRIMNTIMLAPLRQANASTARKTLSCSKSDFSCDLVARLYRLLSLVVSPFNLHLCYELQHICFGDNTDELRPLQHRQTANLLLHHEAGRFLHRGVGSDGDSRIAHD